MEKKPTNEPKFSVGQRVLFKFSYRTSEGLNKQITIGGQISKAPRFSSGRYELHGDDGTIFPVFEDSLTLEES
jgi:hypothetical protein